MMEFRITRMSSDELKHHGVKGQKHGERRYQNPDGSLTPEGREHYGIGERIHQFGSKLHENRMKSIDRSADRGKDLYDRGKASQLRNAGMMIVRQIGIEVGGTLVSRLGVDNGAVLLGQKALTAMNFGVTISRARDIHNYRARNKVSNNS